jgi:hypothetical protein
MEFGVTEWGMVSFEPDFMVQNTICVPDFLETEGVGAACARSLLPASQRRRTVALVPSQL